MQLSDGGGDGGVDVAVDAELVGERDPDGELVHVAVAERREEARPEAPRREHSHRQQLAALNTLIERDCC